MYKIVEAFRRKCTICVFTGLFRQTKTLKLSVNMIMSKKPLERIKVDLVKIPMYMKLDFKYLMTFKDHYSRMADVFMLINKTS